jgi:hypothetical protein
MTEPTLRARTNILRLILAPSLITLAVTILRLVGERQGWSPLLFGRVAGGGGALVGISWLPLIFGPYFGAKLSKAGQGPAKAGRAFGFAALGLVLFVIAANVGFGGEFFNSPGRMAAGYALIAVATGATAVGWPPLGKTLLAYGYAARIPVAVIMYFALAGQWGTHYDALPAGYNSPTTLLGKYLLLGLLPQLIFWIGYTVIVGSLLGILAAAVPRKRKPPIWEPPPASPDQRD